MVIREWVSQGNVLRLYHGGYLVIVPSGVHTGFQLYPEMVDDIAEAIEAFGRKSPGAAPGEPDA
jgi:hypothetical protein